MKFWHVIICTLLLTVTVVLGYKYLEVKSELNSSNLGDNNVQTGIPNAENTIVIDEVLENKNEVTKLEQTLYEIVNKNVIKYQIYNSEKTAKENVDNYLNYMCALGGILGQDVPEFSNPNELDESYLDQIIWAVHSSNDDAMIIDNGYDAIISRTFIQSVLLQIFGIELDMNNVDLNKFESIYPFENYNDLYRIVTYSEVDELLNGKYVITNIKETNTNIEVSIIEYLLCDQEFILDVGEKSKRDLKNLKDEVIKTYDIEAVKGDVYLETEVRDVNKIVTDEDIEKYVVNNKDKFDEKKIVFTKDAGRLQVVSCEIIK